MENFEQVKNRLLEVEGKLSEYNNLLERGYYNVHKR